ncbi:hypothetical protein ACSSS7_008435 [Eimeria intestinalis]
MSPCAAGDRAPTPDGCSTQHHLPLSAAAAAPAAGEPQPQVAIAILRCPSTPYDTQHQQQLEQQQVEQEQQGALAYRLVQPPPHMLQQLQVPSYQNSLRSNVLREEVGEIGSKGALESFSPTFATELLADIELEGGDDSPAAPAAACAAPASAPAATLCIEVPLQQADTATDRKQRSLDY